MHNHYKDILDRISEPPAWFDDVAVPRFVDFMPGYLGNIYAREAALAEISCQGCGHMFTVALTDVFAKKGFSLSDEIRLNRVHYGDPPNVRCCDAGPSMNSVMRRIVQYWSRDMEVSSYWQRDPSFEGPIDADAPEDPPDTIAEIFAAGGPGVHAILVRCTSHLNRYDLAGRTTAALAGNGRVLVACDQNYRVVARRMLDGLVPAADIGRGNEGRIVTLADFSQLEELHLPMFDGIVVLAGLRPRNEQLQQVWDKVAGRLTTEVDEKIRIEFALAHSRCMLSHPDIAIDAGRSSEDRQQGGPS